MRNCCGIQETSEGRWGHGRGRACPRRPGSLALGWWEELRAPGTNIPGVITAGTFYQEGEKVFWDVHDPHKTVVIQLRDEKYSRLVVEVEDPSTTAQAIQERLKE